MDMTQFTLAKGNQVNADDLISGPRTITITRVAGNDGNKEQPVAVFFDGDEGKPFMPCKTMRRLMVAAWGADSGKYKGRMLTLYRDPTVKFGGMETGGVRISHMSHIDSDLKVALTSTRGKRGMVHVKPISDVKPPIASAPTSTPTDHTASQEAARDAARGGKAVFAKWWKDNPDGREGANLILEELKAISAEADGNQEEA